MPSLFKILFLICSLLIYSKAEISDLRACADPHCKSLISQGRTTQRYIRKEEGVLSFMSDEIVSVYSKEAGINKELWGGKINERSGYIPKKFIKEERVFINTSDLNHLVPTRNNSLHKKEHPKSEDINQDITQNSDSTGEINASSENVNIDSNSENIFSNEFPLSVEDAEFVSLEALSSKGEEKTLNPSLKDESEDKKVESIVNDVGSQTPVNNNEDLQFPIDNKIENQAPIDNKIEYQAPFDNKIQNQVPIDNKIEYQAPIDNKIKNQVPIDSKIENQASINNKEESKEEEFLVSINKDESKILKDVESSQVHTDNKEGSQVINKEGSRVPVNKDGSQIPTANVEGSQVLVTNEGYQNPINIEGSQFPTNTIEGSQVHIDNKEGIQVPSNNNEGSRILSAGKPSEEIKVIEEEKLLSLLDKEKPHLELTNNDNKIEEEMGNNEGNGNEGEDNGSEYIGDLSSQNNVETPVDGSSTTQPIVDKIPDSPLLKEEIGKEYEEERSPSTESSNFVSPASVTDIKFGKLTEKTAETVLSDKSLSDTQILKPEPPKFEVVDGTTIALDEPNSYQPSIISEHEVTRSNLESSSNRRVNPSIGLTTPTPRLPDGTPITQPPLLQNLKIVKNSMAPMNSETDIPPISEVTKVLPEEPIASENHLQNEKTVSIDSNKDSLNIEQKSEEDEFSTPRPETVLKESVNNAMDIQMQSESKRIDKLEKEIEILDEKYSSLTKEDQVISSNTLENKLSEGSNPLVDKYTDTESSENHVDQQNQIVGDESINSVQDETVKPSNPEDIDTDKGDNEGILSSISNIFGYHKSDSGIENKEEEFDNHQEYSEESNSESEKSVETSSENTGNTPDLTKGTIPFIDPYLNPEESEAQKTTDNLDYMYEKPAIDLPHYEKPVELPHSDNSEELDISSSIKKKLLHVSEAVLSEGMALAIEGELADPHLSKGTVTFLLVVAGTIIVLYISHMIIVKLSRESPILENLNKLDRNHRVLVEENKTLKRQLTDSNGQIKSAMVMDPAALQKVKQQFEETKKKLIDEAEELRERNHLLEVDLEASTANEVELHRMLDELLANQNETTNFEDSVNSLQLMLENQREIVDNLTSDLALKTRLNEELRIELKDSKSKLSKLEYQIEQLSQSLEDVNRLKQELTKKLTSEEENSLSLREMNNTLRKEADKVSKESEARYQETQKLLKDIRKLKQVLYSKEAECQISKECVKKLQIFSNTGGNDVLSKLSEVFKIIEVKTQLESIQFERTSIQAQLEERENIVSSQCEDLKRIESENISLKSSSERLQKERDDAVSKLEILSQYYEEKESQLKKALESQEDLLHSAEGSANLVSNRIQTYELELVSCRSQIESLKNELEEQKQSYKIQLSNEEKKLHETWLSARAAERRQEELRQENTQLRQSLTQLQRDTESKMMFNKPPPKRVNANGSISSPITVENDINIPHPPLDMDGTMPHLPPPPMMFHPPPPGLPPLPPRMFGPPLPPPPHHHPLPDRRLPPAGRIASPPGYDRRSYSPESDRSRYSDHRYSPSAFLSNNQRGLSPDRRSDLVRRNIRRDNRRSPSLERHSPRERWYNHSPPGGHPKNHRSPPLDYYDSPSTQDRRGNHTKGKKTSTPIGPNDR